MRECLAVVVLLIGLLVIATVFATPWLPEDWLHVRLRLLKAPFLIFYLLYVAALFLLGRPALRRPPGSMIFLMVAAALAFPFGVIFIAFGQVDMISVMFHLQAGVFGLGIGALKTEILTTLGCLCCLLVACYLLSAVRWLRHVPLLVGVLLVLCNPYLMFQAKRWLLPVPQVDLTTAVVSPKVASNPQSPDIVYLYLEGLDRRFLDPALGGETAALLQGLEGQGLSFTGIAQMAGTGWTIAGMVASQCGIPLLPRGNLHDVIIESFGESFLPSLRCLGDLLAEQGYEATFIMGADARFAGTAAFFRTHGYARAIAKQDMAKYFAPDVVKAADVTWFLDDQMVFDAARTQFAEAMTKEAPFLLTVATIGAHGKLGYLSRDCTRDKQATTTGNVFQSARCMTDLTVRFVADLQAAYALSGRRNGLRIILQSDHLNHARSDLPAGPEIERNTLILIGGNGGGQKVARSGTMLDVYPTVLDWLGFPAEGGKAGLGVSLLSPDAGDTLVTTWSLAMLDRIVMDNIPLFEAAWVGSE